MILIQLEIEQLESLIQNAVRKVNSETPKANLEQTDTDELLTVHDTARFLSLSVPTIYGLIHKGELPVMKRSKRCYFTKGELLKYLKEGRKKTLLETASAAEHYCKTKKG